MANLDFVDKVAKAAERLKTPEQIAGLGLLQPFNIANSGARKILASTQRQQIFSLMRPEPPIIGTGYDNKFGDHSSSITKAEEASYRVIAKISKFSFAPEHHYWIILENLKEKKLEVVERIAYHYITESYGYLYNNEYLDSLSVGSIVNDNTIIQKSLAFDDYNNRADGVNLNVAYMALDDNMEDSEIFSDAAAAKMTSPLIKPVDIMINENDIPLNMYGNNEVYKAFPDIGEKVRDDGKMICLRKEKKEEAFFMQAVERLSEPLMTDEKRTVIGTVVDVDIRCNKPEYLLDNIYYQQFKMYYDELRRYSNEIVSIITVYAANGYELSYDLEELFALAKRTLNGDQYIEKNRPFSFMIAKITVLEELPLNVGDKVTNMFGSKGVISKIIPQHLMPKMPNGEYVDVILNSSTMYNRENPGQLYELSTNHIGKGIVDLISTGIYDVDESFDMIVDFINCVSPSHAAALKSWGANLEEIDKAFFIQSVVDDGCIKICTKPISESFDIDKLAIMYEKFPAITQYEIEVPLKDSNGNIRYVKARRKMTIGKQYMFRLKQFAEEKFSATSLSPTNIRNENTKSKASRDYKEMFSNTPIRMGNMEIEDLNHMGSEYVVTNLMLHSISPHGRRLVEQFYTEDPFNIDIKLDNKATNRQAEIVNTYLKTMGLRLKFLKVLKQKVNPIKFKAISFREDAKKEAIFFNTEKDFDFVKDFEERNARKKRKAIRREAIKFYG